MSAPSDTPPSKGMIMIAAYRAERLSQRPHLRSRLQKSHVARRRARTGDDDVASPADAVPEAAPAMVIAAVGPKPPGRASVFASLVSIDVAEQRNDVAEASELPPEKPGAPQAEAAADSSAETEVVEPAITSDEAESSASVLFAGSAADQPAADETPDPLTPDQSEPTPAGAQAYDPPLAEIGFGPGMLIRLSQLGMYTSKDLAQADAGQLREALGDISRLVDVDAWIAAAKQTARPASS